MKRLVVLVLLVSIVQCLRVEQLKEIGKDSTSINIEWSIGNQNDLATDLNQTTPDPTNNENSWIGFKIKYFTDKLQYTPILLKSILHKKFRLDNLKSGTEYKIQVSAYNSLGNEGPASSLLIVKTNEAGLAPKT